MPTLDNKKLLRLIRYAPVGVICAFAIAVNIIAIQDNREKAAYSIENLRQELLHERRNVIRSQVNQVYQQLILEKSKIESSLKEQIKQRVYEAYGIAHNIYANNPGKSKQEIASLINEALRTIRFFNGRGYFFILEAPSGKSIVQSMQPDVEGQSLWDVKDSNGLYPIQNIINTASHKNETFLQWRYPKPGGEANKDYEKIGFVKRFEPYNWIIGTGDYLEDAEKDARATLLKRFSTYEYGNDGYFFILDQNGTLLAHHDNDFFGINLKTGNQIKADLLSEMLDKVAQGGGYVRYQKPLTLSGTVSLEQVSYVRKIKGWNWIIGTGFYTQTFEKYLQQKAAQLADYNRRSLTKLIFLATLSTLLLSAISLYVSHLITRRFDMFQRRIMKDFKELKKTKDQMEYIAQHDALTGLPNRSRLRQEISQCIERSKKAHQHLAVMFVDLDNFKNINDLYGHTVGDKLLQAVGQKFQALLKEEETTFRFGGDEFIFCFPYLDQIDQARTKAHHIQEALADPIIIDGKILSIGCSIGVALYPDNNTDAESLISMADTVLYRSKATKKGEILFYDNDISERIKYVMHVEHELARALMAQEITVQYQPQITMPNGKLKSVEALARWHSNTLGNVSPEVFISAAEETGLIHSIGLFIFETACQEIYQLSPNGQDAISLSVNVSPMQLMETDFSQNLINICTKIGIDPKRITLEITENILIHDLNTLVLPALSALRNQGFGLSLDDFGTGYSSLRYINNLPLTEIKIDRSFTQKFLDSPQSDTLVKMIIGIGRTCGFTIVGEGIETKEQLDKLSEYGCHLAQGYYFYRPLTTQQLAKCLEGLFSTNHNHSSRL